MQILQLQYFCTVARHCNMSRAAEELWVSQSALSKAIGSLEEELGVRLFERVGRSISLNEAGQFYYEKISALLLEFDDVTKQLRDIDRGADNTVRLLISAANFISSWFLARFRERFPEGRLLIDSCYIASSQDVRHYDFHIYASPADYEETESLLLFEEELLLAMAPHHPLAGRENLRLLDAKGYPFQTLTPNENLRSNLAYFCTQAGFQPQVGFSTEDSYTFYAVLGSNDFLALVPRLTAGPALRAQVVLKPLCEPHCRRTVHLAWNKNRYLSEQSAQFLAYCRELFAAGQEINFF